LICDIGMLGSKIFTFGPKSGTAVAAVTARGDAAPGVGQGQRDRSECDRNSQPAGESRDPRETNSGDFVGL
jgi:hypothetical protein